MDNRRAGLGALEFGSLTDIQTDVFLAAVAEDETYASRARPAALKAAASFRIKFWDEEKGSIVMLSTPRAGVFRSLRRGALSGFSGGWERKTRPAGLWPGSTA